MSLLEMRSWLDERLCAPAKLLCGGDALESLVERDGNPIHWNQRSYSAAAMHSISTRAPFGRVLTAKAQRAGNGALKNSE